MASYYRNPITGELHSSPEELRSSLYSIRQGLMDERQGYVDSKESYERDYEKITNLENQLASYYHLINSCKDYLSDINAVSMLAYNRFHNNNNLMATGIEVIQPENLKGAVSVFEEKLDSKQKDFERCGNSLDAAKGVIADKVNRLMEIIRYYDNEIANVNLHLGIG